MKKKFIKNLKIKFNKCRFITYIKLFNLIKKKFNLNYYKILNKLNINYVDKYNNTNEIYNYINFNNKNYKKEYKNINNFTKIILKNLIKLKHIKIIKYIIKEFKKKNLLKDFFRNFKFLKKLNIIKKKFLKIAFKRTSKHILLIFKNILIEENNTDLILELYKMLEKIYLKINIIKYKLYDILYNLSGINLLEFNLNFYYYNSNLNWIINISKLTIFNENFKINYINFIKNYQKKLKFIEKKIGIKIDNFLTFFDKLNFYKIKLEYSRDNIINLKSLLVKKFCNKYLNSDLYLDYIQEGNLGLIKAVNSYNLNYDINFKLYIFLNIKYNINKYLYKNIKLIKLPDYISNNIKKINNIIDKFKSKKDNLPTLKYISKETCINEKKLIKIINYRNPAKSFEKLKNYNKFEEIYNFKNKTTEDILINNYIKKNIEDSFRSLNKNELIVISMRFGLNGYSSTTLYKIGLILNLSKERIRQIQNNALKKIKKFKNNKNNFI